MHMQFNDDLKIDRDSRAYIPLSSAGDFDFGHGQIPPDDWYVKIMRRLPEATRWLPAEIGEDVTMLARVAVATAVLDRDRHKVLVDADGRIAHDRHCQRGDTPVSMWAPYKERSIVSGEVEWQMMTLADNYSFFSANAALSPIYRDDATEEDGGTEEVQVWASNEQTAHPVTSLLRDCRYNDYGELGLGSADATPEIIFPVAYFAHADKMGGLVDDVEWRDVAEVDPAGDVGEFLV